MEKIIPKLLLNVKGKYYPALRLVILLLSDIFALYLSISLPIKLYLSNNNYSYLDYVWIIYSFCLIGPIIFLYSKVYTSLIKYINSLFLYRVILSNTFLAFVVFLIGYFLNFDIPNLKFWSLVLIISPCIVCFFRILQRDILLYISSKSKKHIKKNQDLIAIYGAGMAGALLLNSLNKDINNKVYTFIDDNQKLHKRTINGIPVCSLEKLKELVKNKVVNKVLLAMPSLSEKD